MPARTLLTNLMAVSDALIGGRLLTAGRALGFRPVPALAISCIRRPVDFIEVILLRIIPFEITTTRIRATPILLPLLNLPVSIIVAVLFRNISVFVRHTLAVRGIVVPIVIIDIGAVEIIISIDVDVDVSAPPIGITP